MGRFKKAFWNNRGDALIFGVLMTLVVLILFYCVLSFIQLKATTAYIRNTAEQVLDTYTSTQGKDAVESIKNGTDFTVVLDKDLYIQRYQTALGIGSNFTGYSDSGRVRFQITNIALDYAVTNTINSKVTFHLVEPVYFFGFQVPLTGDVTVTSKYNIK